MKLLLLEGTIATIGVYVHLVTGKYDLGLLLWGAGMVTAFGFLTYFWLEAHR
jgi:hypothetical protein